VDVIYTYGRAVGNSSVKSRTYQAQTKIILTIKRLLQCTVDLQRLHQFNPLLRIEEDRESFLNTI